MKPLYLLIAFASLFLATTSCKKKLPNVPVNAAMKEAYAMSAGTYWVFRDTVTGRYDSFALREVTNTNYQVSDETYDQIAYHITQYNTTNLADTVSWHWEMVDKFMKFYWIKSGIHYEYAPVPYPFTNGVFAATANVEKDTVRNFPTYATKNDTFYNVTKINFLDYGVNDWIILNKEAGFITLILSRINKVWVIDRWEIIR
ncbi:MAG: hypothetical protein V4649_17185 [Bacteroidota bacterium]